MAATMLVDEPLHDPNRRSASSTDAALTAAYCSRLMKSAPQDVGLLLRSKQRMPGDCLSKARHGISLSLFGSSVFVPQPDFAVSVAPPWDGGTTPDKFRQPYTF